MAPPAGTSFSLSQIQHMQNLMDPRIKENFSDDESSVPDERHAFLDAPTQIDSDLHNNDTHVNWREEERMFQNAKMYTDQGNGCFLN